MSETKGNTEVAVSEASAPPTIDKLSDNDNKTDELQDKPAEPSTDDAKQVLVNKQVEDKDSKVQALNEAWKATQTRAFTAWVNFQLRPTDYKIENLESDFGRGVEFGALLSVLAGALVKVNKTPRMRIHHIENVAVCLKFMESKGCKLVNISAPEIVDKNMTLILGTIWILIRKFRIENLQIDDAAGNDALLLWVQKKVRDYGVIVHNFHTSWQNGLALAALIHSTYPGILNYHKLPKDNPSEILETCFVVSEKRLDIPQMLAVSDLVGIERPDEHSVLAYISAHYHAQQLTQDSLAKYLDGLKLKDRIVTAITKLSEPIMVESREQLEVLMEVFKVDESAFQQMEKDFVVLAKLADALNLMGLPGTMFDYSPYEEIKRLIENLRKLFNKRVSDLESEDAALRNIEALLQAYLHKINELRTTLNTSATMLDNLPSELASRLQALREQADLLASLKRTFEELSHSVKRLANKVSIPEDSPRLSDLQNQSDVLTTRISGELEQVQQLDNLLREYAKKAPLLDTWIDKVKLQLSNLTTNISEATQPTNIPSYDELHEMYKRYQSLVSEHELKKEAKEFDALQALVETIRSLAHKIPLQVTEAQYVELPFKELEIKWNMLGELFGELKIQTDVLEKRMHSLESADKRVKRLEELLQAQKSTDHGCAKEITEILSDIKGRIVVVTEARAELTEESITNNISAEKLTEMTSEFDNLLGTLNSNLVDLGTLYEEFMKKASEAAELFDTFADKLNEALADVGRNLVAEFKQLEEQEHPKMQSMHTDVSAVHSKLQPWGIKNVIDMWALFSVKWDSYVEAMERMKKRVRGRFTSEEDIRKSLEYVASCRGPKFQAPPKQDTIGDTAMESNTTRICILGAETTGKTSIVKRLTENTFTGEHVSLGECHTDTTITVDGKPYKVDILDFNGSDIDTRSKANLWGDAFVFTYNIASFESFERMMSHYRDVIQSRRGIPFGCVIVGTHCDGSRAVTLLEGNSFAISNHCKHLDASSKLGKNVTELFVEVIRSTSAMHAVSARLAAEAAAVATQKKKKKPKKEKTDKEPESTKVLYNPLTSSSVIEWKVVRLHQLLVLFELQKDESNRRCADCNTEYPDWVSMGFMVLLCVQCAHIHKEIIKSPTIPKPKNMLLEHFSNSELQEVTSLCNGHANMVLERVAATNKPKPNDPSKVKSEWITKKYITHELYLSMNSEDSKNTFHYNNKLQSKYSKHKVTTTRTGEPAKLAGPTSESKEIQKGDFFSVRSESSLPRGDAEDSGFNGGNIVDYWSANIGQQHVFATLADGSRWGVAAATTARQATDGFMHFVDINYSKVHTVEDAANLLLKGCLVAHDNTTKHLENKRVINYWEVGTTSLLGVLLLTGEKGSLGALCVSVGSCKAFLVNTHGKATKIVDITENSRPYGLDEEDPGGELGPAREAGAPDLRNLQIFYTPVEPNDLILMMTAGVYENFDPQYLGMSPSDFHLKKKSWRECNPAKVEKVKTTFIDDLMKTVIEKAKTPTEIVNSLQEHVRVVTTARRAFIENEGKNPPLDYYLFPGKLDHASVACFKVQQNYGV